jgi:ESS family glutamate:Na+ symporter
LNFTIENGVTTLNLDMISTLCLALLLLIIGNFIKKRINFLEKFCIPSPVIGGLLFSLLAFGLRQTKVINISMDITFQSPFMIAFFTTVGLGASFAILRKGGYQLVAYWLLAGFLAIAQNVVGVGVAESVGIHPVLGVMAGAVSLEGGMGAAAAFGPTAESMGVNGATAVAIASATFGLISGGIIGGPLARYLIVKYKLSPDLSVTTEDLELEDKIETNSNKITADEILIHMAAITVCMAIGSLASSWFSNVTKLVLPGYVGAMFTAVILRNINDKAKFVELKTNVVDLIGDVCLSVFLSIALMNLKLWDLADLALPLFIILFTQVIFMILYCIFICFKVLGKNFDAAIMCAGMIGHGLGATPNAIANMRTVTDKYGPSPRSFLIVPIVGAFLIDLFGIPAIVWFMNAFS